MLLIIAATLIGVIILIIFFISVCVLTEDITDTESNLNYRNKIEVKDK